MGWRKTWLVLLVCMLVSPACGDDDDNTATTANGATGSASSTTTGAGDPGGGGDGSSAASGPGGTSTDGTSPGGSGRTDEPDAPPGVYEYSVKGTTRRGTPPTTSPYETTMVMTLYPPKDGRQRRTEVLQGAENSTESTLALGADAIELVEFKLTEPAPKDFLPPEPVLLWPKPATSRASWSWDLTSTDGTTKVHAEYSSAPNETVTVAGRQLDCWVVHAKRTFTSEQDGVRNVVTEDRTEWISPAHLVAVKIHSARSLDTHGMPGGFHGDETYELTSLEPSRGRSS